ncbi:MAG: NAD(P)H-dependent oxidoreductase [Gammaproteobacteria bacterium]
MGKHILVIQGHPDHLQPHFCHALADAYAEGAAAAGHAVRRIDVAALDFPLLRSPVNWEQSDVPSSLAAAQDDILWAGHLVLFFPLWLGDMPALLKGFLEQVLRPGFAIERSDSHAQFKKRLSGRSARVVVTMGMPAALYRWVFRAHSVRALERNILGFVGFAPVHETLIGGTGNLDAKQADKWLAALEKTGASGE